MGTIFLVIFTHCRNAARGDNSMYCMIPDPFPSTAFGKGSAIKNNDKNTNLRKNGISDVVHSKNDFVKIT